MTHLRLLLCLSVLTWGTICLAAPPAEVPVFEVNGQVVDQNAKPIANAQIFGTSYDGRRETTSDAEGKFKLTFQYWGQTELVIVAEDQARKQVGMFSVLQSDPIASDEIISIKLQPQLELPIEVTDAEGKPVEGAQVQSLVHYFPIASTVSDSQGHASLRLPKGQRPSMLMAFKPDVGFDYRVVVARHDKAFHAEWFDKPPVILQFAPSFDAEFKFHDRQARPIEGVELSTWRLRKPTEPDDFQMGVGPKYFSATTGPDGIARIGGIPNWKLRPLEYQADSPDYTFRRIPIDVQQAENKLIEVTLDRLVPVSGHVRFADGQPLADVEVIAVGGNYAGTASGTRVKTDPTGKFETKLAPDSLYALVARDQRGASPLLEGIVIEEGKPITNLELTASPPTRVFGRVVSDKDATPLANYAIRLLQFGRSIRSFPDIELPNPTERQSVISPKIFSNPTTDEDEKFEFFLGPGSYEISGPFDSGSQRFTITDNQAREFNFQVQREERAPIDFAIVTGDPQQAVPTAIVEGYSNAGGGHLRFRTDSEGNYTDERPKTRMTFHAKSADGRLAGIVEVGPDDKSVTIPISAVGSVEATFIDRRTKLPKSNETIKWGRIVYVDHARQEWMVAWGGETKTDEYGHFKITDLVIGQEYAINVRSGEHRWRRLKNFVPLSTKQEDLGPIAFDSGQ